MASERDGTVAAIDCGTNSTRLLVVDTEGNTLTRLMRITRLGQGVDATQKLDQAAVERTLSVLVGFRRLMDDLAVSRGRMVATSAVRDAVNGREFLVAATETVGFPAELLSGEEEGQLAYSGATADLPSASGDDVVVDIGGGSTELVVARGSEASAVSGEVGCVRLTERYLHHDPPTTAELASAISAVDRELDAAVVAIPQLATLQPDSRLIGLAGTVSTLTSLELGLVEYNRDRIHHFRLEAAVVRQWCDVLAGETNSDRALRPGMVVGRQDVILGGALILRQVMDRLRFDSCLVSESDILDGLVMPQR